MKITYQLPMPPSVNTCYYTDFKTKSRHKTKQYREWTHDCDREVLTQKRYVCSGDEQISVIYTFYTSWFTKAGKIKKRDVANLEKPLTDYLHNIIHGFDDCQIFEMRLQKVHSNMEKVIIEIEELPV